MARLKTIKDTENGEGRKLTTIPLAWLMAIAFGGLVALSVGAVLVLTVRTSFINTFSLLNDQAIGLFDTMEQQIKVQAHQAERTVSAVARLYAQGQIGNQEGSGRHTVLEALLLSMPAVEGVFVFKGKERVDALFRRPEGVIGTPPPSFQEADLATLFALDRAEKSNDLIWADPVVIGQTMFHTVAHRLERDGQTQGVAVAILGRSSVSRIMVRLGAENKATVFMLGKDGSVIAHSGLPGAFRDRISIPLGEFPDKILRLYADAEPEDENFEAASEHGVQVRVTGRGEDGGYLFMTKQLEGYSATPFKLGIYYPRAEVGEEILRAVLSMFVGAAGLLAAVFAAIVVGRQISKPAAQVARTASQFSRFEIDQIEPLPGSRIREINDQTVALNRMRTTLMQFTRYVPRELVARLMRSGEDANISIEREITIMFTDIAGFTGFSERLNAAEITTALNEHFAMISRHVAETAGTVDKFLGDGVLAFWGAPEADKDHALHAVEAARAIVRSMQEDNAARKVNGEAPLRLRIGIHTGRAVIGNIGGPDRQNYTIVGDAVNVAQRLEQMSRDVMGPDDDTAVLVSAAVVNAVGDKADFTPDGTRIVRGRERPIATYILNVGGAKASGNVVPFTGSDHA